jgi:hypothetical protein
VLSKVFIEDLPLNFFIPFSARFNPALLTGFPYLYAKAAVVIPPTPIITASELSPNLWAIVAVVLFIAWLFASFVFEHQ